MLKGASVTRSSRWNPPTTPFMWEHVAPLGVTRSMIHTAASGGRIARLGHGVYIAAEAAATAPVAAHLQRAHALQLRRPDAIASHDTAALAWELDLEDPVASAAKPVAFIIPSSRSARSESSSGARIAVRDLPHHHRAVHPSGLLVTTPARTAVDVAAELPMPEALITLDSAARLALQDLVGSRWLRDTYVRPKVLARATEPLEEAASHAATQFTRRSLGLSVAHADPRRESALESLSFGHMVAAGLPLPDLQVRVQTPEGRPVFPDFLWAEEMVIGEADGLTKYATATDLHREKLRQEILEQMGYRIVRWSYREMRERPAVVLRRIEAALEARRTR